MMRSSVQACSLTRCKARQTASHWRYSGVDVGEAQVDTGGWSDHETAATPPASALNFVYAPQTAWLRRRRHRKRPRQRLMRPLSCRGVVHPWRCSHISDRGACVALRQLALGYASLHWGCAQRSWPEQPASPDSSKPFVCRR